MRRWTALAMAVAMSGCSFGNVRRTPELDGNSYRCSSVARPAADAFGAVVGFFAAWMAARAEDPLGFQAPFIVVPLVFGSLYAASAVYGVSVNSECKDRLKQFQK